MNKFKERRRCAKLIKKTIYSRLSLFSELIQLNTDCLSVTPSPPLNCVYTIWFVDRQMYLYFSSNFIISSSIFRKFILVLFSSASLCLPAQALLIDSHIYIFCYLEQEIGRRRYNNIVNYVIDEKRNYFFFISLDLFVYPGLSHRRI